MAKARRAQAARMRNALRRTVDDAAVIIEEEAAALTGGTASNRTRLELKQ